MKLKTVLFYLALLIVIQPTSTYSMASGNLSRFLKPQVCASLLPVSSRFYTNNIRAGQIYAPPFLDVVFKRLMNENEIRDEFISVSLGIKVKESRKMIGPLNPINAYGRLRDFLDSYSADRVLKRVRDHEGSTEVYIGGVKDRILSNFLKELSLYKDDLGSIIPCQPKGMRIDLICKLEDGESINVELQAGRDMVCDYRALWCLSTIFSNNIHRKNKYTILRPVVGINILNMMLHEHPKDVPPYLTNPWSKGAYYKRDYQFKNTVSESGDLGINAIRLVQYYLPVLEDSNVKERNKLLYDWLNFFRNGTVHDENYVESFIDSDALKEAYEIIKLSNYSSSDLEETTTLTDRLAEMVLYEKEYGERRIAASRKERDFEIAKKLFSMGMEKKLIIESTGLSEEELDSLSKTD